MKKYINVSEMGTISISYRGAENSHGNSIKIKEKDWRYPCS